MSTLCPAQNSSQLNYFIKSSGFSDCSNIHEDDRIKKRIEACQQGMHQLETLRSKHLKLMDDLRNEYSSLQTAVNFTPRNKTSVINSSDIQDIRSQQQPSFTYIIPLGNSSNLLITNKNKLSNRGHIMGLSYPTSEDGTLFADTSSVSHRSSMSVDSGYLSVSTDISQNWRNSTIIDIQSNDSPMSYNTYRKISMDENNGNAIGKNKNIIGSSNIAMGTVKKLAMNYTKNIQELNKASEIVKTTLEGTAALRPNRLSKSQNRPWSMYSTSTCTNNNDYINSEISSIDNEIKNNLSFAQTPISQLNDQIKYSTLTQNNSTTQNYNDSYVYSTPNKIKPPVLESNNGKEEEMYSRPIKNTPNKCQSFFNSQNNNEETINNYILGEGIARINNKNKSPSNIQQTAVVITRFSDNLKSALNNKPPSIPGRNVGVMHGTPIPSKRIRKGWLESEEL